MKIKTYCGNINVSDRRFMICGDEDYLDDYKITYGLSYDMYFKTKYFNAILPSVMICRVIDLKDINWYHFYIRYEKVVILTQPDSYLWSDMLSINFKDYVDESVTCRFLCSTKKMKKLNLYTLSKKIGEGEQNDVEVAKAYIDCYELLCQDNIYEKAIAHLINYQIDMCARKIGL